MLGMTLAHRLAQHGHSVSLFEAAEHLGGLASAWKLGDVVWDRHYHVTLLSDTYLRRILAELDLETEIEWVETRTRFYSDGKLYSMSNTLEFLLFPPLGFVDKLRLGATIFYASRLRDWKKLEKVLVADWLRKWSGARTFEKIWHPLLRAKLGDTYKQASAAFIWDTIARMYAARRTGLKREMFGYVPGGYARILACFESVLRRENVQIKTGCRVLEVRPNSDNKVTINFEGTEQEVFDQVVLTVPGPIALTLCPQLSKVEKSKFESIQYLGVICASLLMKQPLADFYVTNITDSWAPFTGIIEMSALVDRQQFQGRNLVYLPKYVVPEDPAFSWPDEQIEEMFLDALTRMYPDFNRESVECFRVSRARLVFALSTLNYSDRLPPLSTSVPGVHIVNSAHIVNGTLNVNETVQLAEGAVRKLLKGFRPSGEPEGVYHCEQEGEPQRV